MKKLKEDFREMTDVLCKHCNKPIKKNVINRNPSAHLCYTCYLLEKGKEELVYNRKRNGKQVRRVINLKLKQKANLRIYKKSATPFGG